MFFNYFLFTLELIYIIYTKSIRHVFTNWLVLLGFIILTFDFLKMFLAK